MRFQVHHFQQVQRRPAIRLFNLLLRRQHSLFRNPRDNLLLHLLFSQQPNRLGSLLARRQDSHPQYPLGNQPRYRLVGRLISRHHGHLDNLRFILRADRLVSRA